MKLLWSLAAVAGLWLLAGARPSPADQPVAPTPQEHEKAAALVKQLGEKSFRVRERAARELLKLGLKAKPALVEGARSGDVQVRNRCRDLLVEVEHAGLRARLDAFLADKNGKQEHDLPGWKLYRELVGDNKAARQFFAEMYQAHPNRLAVLESSPAQAGRLAAARCEQHENTNQLGGGLNWARDVRLTDVASLYLIASHPRADMPHTASYQLAALLHRPAEQQAHTTGGPAPLKELVLGWMARETDERALRVALRTAVHFNMKETLELALKLARDKKRSPTIQACALVAVGKFGGREHTPVLKQFLDDKSEFSQFSFSLGGGIFLEGATQVRDVALAMLVHLTGQKHADYGFAFCPTNDSSLLWAGACGFTTEQAREVAFKKWDDEKAKLKK